MTPDLPPLMTALACVDDPMQVARDRAAAGVDAGLMLWRDSAQMLDAALILAPDLPLRQAMAALPACMVGLQNALGSLGPEELAVLLGWDGTIWLNGACAGRFRVAASASDPKIRPDWLIVGFALSMRPPPGQEGGDTPDRTSLFAEGCVLAAADLLGAWGRHALFWLSDLDQPQGRAALARDWQGLCLGLGEGSFLGLDEDFGQITAQPGGARTAPLTTLLEAP